jgi:putative peptide modification system cyclase
MSVTRKLAAVVIADVVGYSRLMERDEAGTHTRLRELRQHLFDPKIAAHGGRTIRTSGDGMLLEFPSATAALRCAVEVQREMGERNLSRTPEDRIELRVGINLGDIIVESDEIAGDGVNMAARLETLAEPGGICVSAAIQEQVHEDLGVAFVDAGLQQVKNISKPVRVYHVALEKGASPSLAKTWRAHPWWRVRRSIVVVTVLVLIVAAVSMYDSTRPEPALAFGERDWVVIADLVDVNTDKTLDGALSIAFRIGLEQSRFVNVVPEGQVRQALTRMQRDPTTAVDRYVASEIALREKARAVIAPSIAQYGRKMRFSAELIDPHGPRTVSIQTADAGEVNELLPAVDGLLRDMRMRLGESLKELQLESQPLAEVTTSNLDALRVYSQGVQQARRGEFEQARRLFAFATELDPEFATAYAGMGSALFSLERYAEARVALEKAASRADRITERERLFVRGLLARFEDPQAMLNVWRTYADLYPEYGIGQNNIGYVSYRFVHDYDLAEGALVEASRKRVLLPNYTLHVLGHVLLAEEKLEAAEQRFRGALELSSAAGIFGLADALVARGKLDEAAQYLQQAKRQSPEVEVDRSMHWVTLFIARREIGQASAALDGALKQAAQLPSPNARWRAEAATIALLVAQGDDSSARDLARKHLAELASKAAQTDSNLEAIEQLLYAAGWAARVGLTIPARDALAWVRAHGNLEHWPVRARLAEIAEAELDLSSGHPDAVITRFASKNTGSELWESHELLVRALHSVGKTNAETGEIRWLAAHPGLAYAQWTDQLLGEQARALALADAQLRSAAAGR